MMKTTIARARRGAFAAAVAAAMGFGGRSALAEPAPERACGDPFANGSCTTTSGCAKFCRDKVGAGSGSCSRGCCYCIWF